MELKELLQKLEIREYEEFISPYWEMTNASYPVDGPHFLNEEWITYWREFSNLPAEVDDVLILVAQKIAANPELAQLAWHCHELSYVHRDYDMSNMRQWPETIPALGDDTGLLYLLVALGALPIMRRLDEERGIPEEITRATTTHYAASTRCYAMHHDGRWGILPATLFWLRNHTAGELHKLGRLEYMVRPFRGLMEVYRNASGEVVALATEGTDFTAKGLRDAGGSEGGWIAHLQKRAESVTGTPISPAGHALKQEVTLDLCEWKLVLSTGDPIIEMHIPPGGGMSLERCEDSMRRAIDFFSEYYPERSFLGFSTASWILDPGLEQIVGPESNMVKFLKELYLFPYPSTGRDGFYFIWGKSDIDEATAARDTSLQRAILDHLAAGGRVNLGGMFMLLEDFEQFGTQYYRRHFPFE